MSNQLKLWGPEEDRKYIKNRRSPKRKHKKLPALPCDFCHQITTDYVDHECFSCFKRRVDAWERKQPGFHEFTHLLGPMIQSME